MVAWLVRFKLELFSFKATKKTPILSSVSSEIGEVCPRARIEEPCASGVGELLALMSCPVSYSKPWKIRQMKQAVL